jgi:hypothetical protein
VVDVKIDGEIDAQGLLEALSAGAQPGLRFAGGARLGHGDPAVNRVIDVARYAVGIPNVAVSARGGAEWVAERIHAALEARELPVVRRIDGIGKRVDVRTYLRTMRLSSDPGDAPASGLRRAGIIGDLLALEVEVDVTGSGGVKIAEVVEAVFGGADMPHRAVRTALGMRRAGDVVVSPLELAALRVTQDVKRLEAVEVC